MHVVTKILLVFCAVLSILLAALTMAYAANAGEIRAGYKSMEAEKIAAQAALADLQSQWASREAQLEKNWKDVNDKYNQFQKENAELQAQRTELRTQLEQAKAEAAAVANRIVELGAAANTLTDLNKAYRDEVTRLRDEAVKSARRESELVDKMNDIESQLEVTRSNGQALQEQLREAQLALQTAKAGGTGDKASDQPFEHIGAPIYARVLDVTKSPAGEDWVTISEGANRGIKNNMIMNIKRGDNFIAKLVIIATEPGKAVGRLDKLGRDVAVNVDDQVLSTLRK